MRSTITQDVKDEAAPRQIQSNKTFDKQFVSRSEPSHYILCVNLLLLHHTLKTKSNHQQFYQRVGVRSERLKEQSVVNVKTC